MTALSRGWLRDRPDWRDTPYSVAAPSAIASKSDWRPLMPPIWDQGPAGSCTGQGVGRLIAYRRRRQGLADIIPSRLMLYYGGRRQEGTTAYDSGAQIRDVIKGFARWGACSEEIWPYDLSLLTVQPSVEAYEAGVGDTGISYARLPDPSFSSSDAVIDALRAALTAGNPFVFGSSIYESFESAKVAADGVVPLPGPNERLIGTHCMVGAGHDDASRMFIVPNSWGPRWGHEGCALIPYEYMGKQGLTADFWHIDLIGRSPDAAAIPVAA